MIHRSFVFGLLLISVFSAAEAAGDAAQGERVYRDFCQKCHGIYGRGDGPALEYFAARPPDLTDSTVLRNRSTDQIVSALLAGGKDWQSAHSLMGSIASSIKKDDLNDAVTFMKTLSVPSSHVSVPSGHDIYTSICWVCHGLDGKGDGPAAAGMKIKPRDFTAKDFSVAGREERVYRTISEGAAKSFHGGSESMIAWKGSLTPQEIRDVMAYIETLKPVTKEP